MVLRDPSVRVREAAAAEVEGRQSDWAYSAPVVALDVLWNGAFLAIGIVVLALSSTEEPCVPLRAWIVGYLLQGAFHSLCVVFEFRRRRNSSGTHVVDRAEWSFSSESDEDFYTSEEFLEGDGSRLSVELELFVFDLEKVCKFIVQSFVSITKFIESANTMLSFIWWIVGFYWVTAGGQSLTRDSPQLYWLCITFLAFDVVIVLICVAVACLIGIAVCCCLPCILAILYVVTDQEGATKEEIDQLPKYNFRIIKEFKKEGDIEETSRGKMIESDSETASEHVIALEDAECCICLSAYDDGAELRELPCNHHFHCTCIDKWLLINATCPLCKFNILRTGNHHQEV
uniref:RING-type E3 ubiquitin transferase n=1 Tax=Cajanus cajan TaxID=3821 RepID=A0A151TBE2_CAJCA|nr:E3 ubiquitin-protein ligase At4g11680 family [Cajanus cajan]